VPSIASAANSWNASRTRSLDLSQLPPTSAERYSYDADGARVRKETKTEVTRTIGPHFEVTVAITNSQTLTTTKYYDFGGQRIAVRQNGTLSYLHGDHLGSTSVTTNNAGAKTSDVRYYAYGGQRSGNLLNLPTDHAFTGQKLDKGSGLLYYGARYYDGALGTFISPDMIVPSPGDPQSLNRYSYVGNSPVCGTDPDGRCWPLCTALIGGAIGAGIGAASVALPQMIRNAQGGQPLTADIDPVEVGKAAAVGFVSGAISGATAGLAAPGAGLAATVAVGALGNVLGGQAAIATDNLLSGRDVSSGMLQSGDMLRDAALGGGGAAVTWGATQAIKGAYASHFARDATHNPNASKVALGSWPEYAGMGTDYTYFSATNYKYLEEKGIGWLTNEKFLDQQTAYQKIVVTVRGTDPSGKLKKLGEGLLRETRYMSGRSGYQARTNGVWFDWYPE
jgi:RHS repeat-associated protein